MIELSPDEVRLLRMRAQNLSSPLPRKSLVEAVQAVCGIQGQLSPAMMLALRARVNKLTIDDIEKSIADSRSLVRTWAMRGTLHLLAAEDMRWLVELLGPIFSAKDERRRLQLGITEEKSTVGLKAIRAILRDSDPLTRHELLDKLIDHGVDIERKGQALIHLIAQAALEGIVCLGPDRENGKSTYVMLDNWVKQDKAMPKDGALTELARRYLTGYAPADVKDFAVWSGLPLTDGKKGWKRLQDADELVEVRVENRTLWLLASQKTTLTESGRSKTVVRLLPAFDTYILGYADRDYLVHPKHQREVYHGGQTVPVVLVDGLAAGVWRYEHQGKKLKITVSPFDSFDKETQHLIAEEAEDIGRFMGLPVSLTIEK
jgi:hypothetical protein